VIADRNRSDLVAHLEANPTGIVTFTSSSTARNFKQLLPQEQFESLTKDLTFASIGPITTDTAKDIGFNIHIESDASTIPGLCKAIADYFS